MRKRITPKTGQKQLRVCTDDLCDQLGAMGLNPLAVLWAIVDDLEVRNDLRVKTALGLMPYVYPKMASIEVGDEITPARGLSELLRAAEKRERELRAAIGFPLSPKVDDRS